MNRKRGLPMGGVARAKLARPMAHYCMASVAQSDGTFARCKRTVKRGDYCGAHKQENVLAEAGKLLTRWGGERP